jgi:alanyl aminopeptidase
MSGLAALVLLLLASACSRETVSENQTDTMVESSAPVGELGSAVMPLRYRLALTIDPRQSTFSGTTEIDVDLTEAASKIWLHGKNLSVSSATIQQDGREHQVTYAQVLDSGVSSLSLDQPITAGTATIRISYTAPFNESSNALYSIDRGDYSYAATQLQPIAARQVFPSFDDPGFKVPFDIEVTAINGDVIVTTTPEVSRSSANGWTTATFATTRPLPTYLLAFVVGPYDVVEYEDIPPNSVRKSPLPLRGIAARGQGEHLDFALKHTSGILTILEEYFAIPYPYEKLDLIATPSGFGGAMENVGAIIYDEYLLLLDEGSSIGQKRAYFSVHAHELAHMWFGDLVTPDWWTDIWLNESFATWMSYKVAHEYWPEGQLDKALQKGAMSAMQNDSLISAREVREHIRHNDQISDSFDGITYQKGGGVLGMIERYAGEENFRNGIRHHLNRYADKSANAPQFMESLARGAELSEIEPIFASFISQPGIPLVSLEVTCSGSTQISIQQDRYAPLGSAIQADSGHWQVPVCISAGLNGSTSDTCHLLTDKEQVFDVPGSCPDYVFPNAGGTGYYRFTLNDQDWQNLINHADRLSGGEALSLLDSLDAAFRAGTVDEHLYLQGIRVLVNHDDWNVVDTTTGYIESLTNILTLEDMQIFEQAAQSIASKRFEAAATDGPQILYERLLRFMLIMARKPELRAPLAAGAARYVGLDGEPDKSAVEPGQLETALSIGVQDIGEPFFDKLLEIALQSENPAEKSAAIGSLARVEDPALIAKLQKVVEDQSLKGTEVTQVMFRQMIRKASTQLTYDWIKSNPEDLFGQVPETFRSSIVPALGSSFCSRKQISEWQKLLEQHEKLLPGYQRSMRQSVESNELCETLRERSRAGILEAMTKISSGD